ncbi:MAG: type II toxin-antitoxin system RelE/ParE family toxin [Ignavibacteriales bacterium]|nr:type II toxin-antitoxin system RelE/ParE family toxin [Ignavibacteriales bacterium]
MNIRFHPEAERDLHDSFLWYEQQRTGLGMEYFLCVDESLERIRSNPKTCPVVHHEIRRSTVRRFPFSILYELKDAEIRVLAVFHTGRSPDRWKVRI